MVVIATSRLPWLLATAPAALSHVKTCYTRQSLYLYLHIDFSLSKINLTSSSLLHSKDTLHFTSHFSISGQTRTLLRHQLNLAHPPRIYKSSLQYAKPITSKYLHLTKWHLSLLPSLQNPKIQQCLTPSLLPPGSLQLPTAKSLVPNSSLCVLFQPKSLFHSPQASISRHLNPT